MGYITVAHRKILRQLDSISYFPNGWDKFIKNQAIHHNLIIKIMGTNGYAFRPQIYILLSSFI